MPGAVRVLQRAVAYWEKRRMKQMDSIGEDHEGEVQVQ